MKTLALALFAQTCAALAQAADATFLKGGTIIDMTGRAPYQSDIDIRDGHIEAIGENLAIPGGARVLDATGSYILPGLTDMQAHVTFLRPSAHFNYDRASSEQVLKMLLA